MPKWNAFVIAALLLTLQNNACWAQSPKALLSFQAIHGDITSLAVSPNGKLVAVGTDSSINLCKIATGERWPIAREEQGIARNMAFSPNGWFFASGWSQGTIKLWETISFRERAIIKCATTHSMLTFSADGDFLASEGVSPDTICIWDLRNSKQKLLDVGKLVSKLFCSAISLDAKFLALADSKGDVSIIQIANGMKLASFASENTVFCRLMISPDGKKLAGGGIKDGLGYVALWDLEGKKLKFDGQHFEPLQRHSDVNALSFSPDGSVIASAGFDETIVVWDCATGKKLASMRGHRDAIRALAFTPDGKLLVSGDASGIVMIWPIQQKADAGKKSKGTNLLIRTPFLYRSERELIPLTAMNEALRWLFRF